ncbi:MAG: hypothetical protein KGS61_10215 [Verrucomicrobia bacterium]|nr:hypothetical protein [Verrucomicrobiota bacterium]
MRIRALASVLLSLALASAEAAPLPELKRSDVVFMYQASRQTYVDYGATVLAWGGTPTPESLAEAKGIKFFSSVGMVTEFNRYDERFPDTYQQGLCRDLDGKPYKVPWLTDHQHKGMPYWWCCTRQPLFRQYISERVEQTVKAGADGVHIDDHLGTAGSLWLGGCFCDRCVAEFRDYLKDLPAAQRPDVGDPGRFDYREVLRAWLAQNPGRTVQQHPLWPTWRTYQLRGAAQFMQELRALAARTAGHPVPMSANAGLLWGPHLNDYQALDFFSAEIEHHAAAKRFDDAPLLAYRLADAVGRPLTSTASGGDWAFIKEHNLPGLVQGWIALGYAAGGSLMAPVHQWCYTPQKGTHWYAGPKDKFAPLYQFVRHHRELFDDFHNYADVTVVFSQRTFDRKQARIATICANLLASAVSYRVAFGGDDVVDHPLRATDLNGTERLLVVEPKDFSPADQALLATLDKNRCAASLEDLLAHLTPAVRVDSPSALRVLPRVKPGAAVLHVLNWDYAPETDSVRPINVATLHLNLRALGVEGAREARVLSPSAPPRSVAIDRDTLALPDLGLWTVVELRRRQE